MKMLMDFVESQKGQALSEYALIIAFVILLLVGVLLEISGALEQMYTDVAIKLP